jgi:hypothetical protein
MMSMVGYMVTWRTYGTWVDEDAYLGKKNDGKLVQPPVWLNENARTVVREAIFGEIGRQKETLLAIAVRDSHVHLVMRVTGRPVGDFVAVCKAVATQALRSAGLEGKVWATGYDKRFCYDGEALQSRVEYVMRHEGECEAGS